SGEQPGSHDAEPQNWNLSCTWIDRMACALFAAPNPASFGLIRAGLSVPSALNCGLRTVRSVGLFSCSCDMRPSITTVLNTLNASMRTCACRFPPSRILRAIDRSVVLSKHPPSRFAPDSRPVLLYVGPANAAVLN